MLKKKLTGMHTFLVKLVNNMIWHSRIKKYSKQQQQEQL